MTNPYNPSDLAREKMDGDERTFAEARATMGRSHAEVHDDAEALGGDDPDETEEGRRERLDVEASDRLQAVQDELAIEREAEGSGAGSFRKGTVL